MSYPIDGKTYLEKIRKNPGEMARIEAAYQAYLKRYCAINGFDDIDVPIKTKFRLLGEAFQYCSETLDGVMDDYHFMWDVIDELLGDKNE